MKNKIYPSFSEAVADIPDGATLMMHSFVGPSGIAHNLITALRDQGAKGLVVISCNFGGIGGARIKPGFKPFVQPGLLVLNDQVRKAITGWAASIKGDIDPLEEAMREGRVDVELVPQGILAEKIRAGGAGLGGFYTTVGVGTIVADGKEKKVIDGKQYILELPLTADYGFVRAWKADRLGNLVYRLVQRSFNPLIATASRVTIAEIDEIVEPGELAPDEIITPGVFVDRIVKIPEGAQG
ncbi:CoA transferase subunit A [Chloroflexota bacterium]